MSDTIDPRNNAESQAAEGAATVVDATSPSATPDSAPVPVEAPAAGQTPREMDEAAGIPDGTAGGNPLAGVTISEREAADAVDGDTGPELPGERRDAKGNLA